MGIEYNSMTVYAEQNKKGAVAYGFFKDFAFFKVRLRACNN